MKLSKLMDDNAYPSQPDAPKEETIDLDAAIRMLEPVIIDSINLAHSGAWADPRNPKGKLVNAVAGRHAKRLQSFIEADRNKQIRAELELFASELVSYDSVLNDKPLLHTILSYTDERLDPPQPKQSKQYRKYEMDVEGSIYEDFPPESEQKEGEK